MTERVEHKKSRGFSLVETLAVVAILVILLSVSAVAAAYYRDYLKITELDNAAREIYMAAENRAVLLGGGGQLDRALESGAAAPLAEGGESASVYVGEDTALSLGLLAGGSVDPALLDEKFYIVYDRASGAVTDVFYAEGGEIQTIARAFELAEQGRDARMRPGDGGPMLGYYGGQQQARSPFTPLPAPEVIVEIENAERLTVKVTFIIPEEARKLMGGYNETALSANARRTVTLSYPGKEPVTLFDSAPLKNPFPNRLATSGALSSGSISYTWVLDELDTNAARDNGRHFHKIFGQGGTSYGEDFTVSAEITLSADGRQPVSASGQDTDNSLFAARSGGDTARLENVRHLQNLDQETSQAGGKTAAVQLADIDCYHAAVYPEYEFAPIVNKDLLSFDGGWSTGEDGQRRRNEILDLHVTEGSAKDKEGAGLFSRTNDGTSAKPVAFTGIRLIDPEVIAPKTSGALAGVAGNNSLFKDIKVLNAAVDGRAASGGVVGSIVENGGSGPNLYYEGSSAFQDIRVINTRVNCANGVAGGVVGKAYGKGIYSDDETAPIFSFDNCWVYWEPEEGQQNLRSLLGSDNPEEKLVAYAITGQSAGGLAGELEAQYTIYASITDSLAATTMHGTLYAGGFSGKSSSRVTVEGSYTDCYLSGQNAAGLLGTMDNFLTAKNIYTAGFIDMKETVKAAGFCLGDAKVTTENSYTAMYYPGQEESTDYTGRIFQLSESQALLYNDEFTNTYYLNVNYGHKSDGSPPESLGGSPGKQAGLAAYPELSSAAKFISSHGWGNSFSRKTAGTSFPYNLQENMRLDIYEFPGLKNLPHYGDWFAEFSRPSLVYYEDYGNGRIGFSGGNARYLSDEESKIGSLNDLTIRSDGYAVAFLKEDVKGGGCQITYRYLDTSNPENPQWAALTQAYGTAALLPAEWDGKEYYLAPLPDVLVTGDLTSPDFFQYLHFSASNSAGLNASGESFYNPHFAEAVVPYASEDGSLFLQPTMPPAQAAGLVSEYASGELIAKRTRGAASIRTPRHFFNLSRYPDYYHNTRHRLSFQQELDLDGGEGVYSGYPGLLEYSGGVQLQSRIGTGRAPFLGVYDGNCRTIRRLAFITDMENDPSLREDPSQVAIGLFGHSNGTLQNIVYKLDGNPAVDAFFPSSPKNTCVGALLGRNGSVGTVENCAVEAVRLDLRAYTTTIYIGGLAGLNEGRIQGSAADCALIQAEGSNYASAYVGGLVGRNQGGLEISECYAVGRLSASADKETSPVCLSGFAGWNSGNISHSYSAMDLRTDGAGAKAFGFCGRSGGGRQSSTFFLNKGNFSYRDQEFSANYDAGESARSVTYKELTAKPSIISGMTVSGRDGSFPYPSAVTNGAGVTHYGSWPEPLDLGEMGVYYWEKHITEKGPEYNYTILAVKPGQKTISRISLSQPHRDQGCVVTDYGYGYYNMEGREINNLSSQNLLYSIGGGIGRSFGELFDSGELAAQQVGAVDRDLAGKIADSSDSGAPAFVCHSFHSFGLDAGLGGLYPDSAPQTSSTPAVPNATLSLSQNGILFVEFTLNPFFAEALSVKYPSGWGQAVGASAEHIPPTAVPGSKENPYGVRTIEQLELINWNNQTRNARTVVEQNFNISQFPYLSSANTTTQYHWTQSHDIKGVEGETYYPIAEYYDSEYTTGSNSKGYLRGWFGGVYDGGGYLIENVNIQGQRASCAGLFGAVYNGTLRDIVLYSSSGNSTVKSGFYDGSESDANNNPIVSNSQWYAIGALAGIAASHDSEGNPGGTAVENCTVSGYKIEAHTYTHSKAGANLWGGTGVGGLLGLSNMNLSGCTADTKIELVAGSTLHDNMRVGGLVGSCQGSVTNCYAGGEISVSSNMKGDRGIYIGGLVGGSYMKPLEVRTGRVIGLVSDSNGYTSNSLINCYSYVRLPSPTDNANIKGLYALGGTGEINPIDYPNAAQNHGKSAKRNCYYLESEVLGNSSREAILTKMQDSYFKTDLEHTVGTQYKFSSGQMTLLGNVRSVYIVNTGTTVNISTTRNRGLCYMKIDVLEDGVSLFQYEGTTGQYKFVGWLVNYAQNQNSSTWDVATDPAYLYEGYEGYPAIPVSCVTGLSYEQLSGQALINEKTIYDLLPAFSEVDNSSGDGIAVPGKYSYPPATRPDLQDRDYPFPTILKKDAGEGQEPCHVHYGGWPLNGFRRQRIQNDQDGNPVYLGGSPIAADLFAGKTYREHLVLTEDVAVNGTWSVELASQAGTGGAPPIVQLAREVEAVSGKPKTYLLELTALRNGSDDLRITYTEPGGAVYSLLVPVHVTSSVKLRPDRLFMFPDDTAEITVKAADRNGVLLTDGLLELKGNPNCGGSGFLAAQTLTAGQTADAFPSVRFNTTGAPAGKTLMSSTNFDYVIPAGGTDAEHRYGGDGDIRVDVIQPWEISFPNPRTCVVTFPASFSVVENGVETDLLQFSGLQAKVTSTPAAVTLTEETRADGAAVYTLTYGQDVTAIPATQLSVSLTMTSRDHKLIPEDGPQVHQLTLTVEADSPAPPEGQSLSPAPAVSGGEESVRRRRWRGRTRKA